MMQEREILEVDVLIVGGGTAGLAAYHLRQLNRDISIAVLEKGKEVGGEHHIGRRDGPAWHQRTDAGLEGERRADRETSRGRPRPLPDKDPQVRVADRSAATPESWELHHLVQQIRALVRQTSRGKRR